MTESQGAEQESFDLGVEPEPPAAVTARSTELLARELGLPTLEFVEVFGAGWQQLPEQPLDGEAALASHAAGRDELSGPWHVAGEPYQVALRPQHDGVELGMPVGQWVGAGTLHWQIGERQHVAGGPDLAEAAQAAIAELLRARRRTFRYCRYCREQTAPEQLLNPDTCYGCGTEWLGVAY